MGLSAAGSWPPALPEGTPPQCGCKAGASTRQDAEANAGQTSGAFLRTLATQLRRHGCRQGGSPSPFHVPVPSWGWGPTSGTREGLPPSGSPRPGGGQDARGLGAKQAPSGRRDSRGAGGVMGAGETGRCLPTGRGRETEQRPRAASVRTTARPPGQRGAALRRCPAPSSPSALGPGPNPPTSLMG